MDISENFEGSFVMMDNLGDTDQSLEFSFFTDISGEPLMDIMLQDEQMDVAITVTLDEARVVLDKLGEKVNQMEELSE